MIYRKTFIMNLAIFICWVLLASVGLYWTWNPLQVYEFSFLSLLILFLYLTVIFTPAISALAIFKENNKKLSLKALVLNYFLTIYLSVFFLICKHYPTTWFVKCMNYLLLFYCLFQHFQLQLALEAYQNFAKKIRGA